MLATNNLVDEVFYEREIRRLFQKAEDEKGMRELKLKIINHKRPEHV